MSVLTVCNGSQCAPEICEESLGEGPSQREVGTKQLGQEDRGETEGKCYCGTYQNTSLTGKNSQRESKGAGGTANTLAQW